MSAAIVVAAVSGAFSLAAIVGSLLSARNVARLSSELEERREVKTKEDRAAELRARYRDPLLGAIFDLQSRLYNIVAKDFLVRYITDGEGLREYAIDNTLYVIAEYLTWVDIIRREIQFLDLGQEATNRMWLDAFEGVRDILARDDIDATLRLFRGEQRAIGETSTVALDNANGTRQHESLGYAEFVARRAQPDFNRWFQRLEGDLKLLAAEPRAHLARPVLLQNALIDMLDIMDPDCVRFPAERRARLRLESPRTADRPREELPDPEGV
jgi:hypothetical protein